MSILETFFFMFEADASKVDDGLKEVDKQAKGVEKQLGLTDKAADGLGKTFVGAVKNLVALAVGSIAIGTLKAISVASAELIGQIDQQSKSMRLDIEVMQQWQGAFESAGASAEGFNSLFKRMQEKSKDPIKAIEQLSNRFHKLSDAQRQAEGKKLGLDQGAIALLGQGKRGIDELLRKQRELGIVTKEQAEIAKQYNDQQRIAKQVMQDVKNQIGSVILPVLTWLLKKYVDIVQYLKQHKPFVYAFFAGLAAVIAWMFFPALIKATVATWAFLSPWILIGGAIFLVAAAIALVIDDIYNFLKGNNSVIGELAKKWPIVGDVIRGIAKAVGYVIDAFADLWETVTTIIGAIVDILKNPQAAIDDISRELGKLIDQFPVLRKVVDGISAAFRAFGEVGKIAIQGIIWVVEKLMKGIAWIAEKLGGFAGKQMAHLGEADPAAGLIQQDMEANLSKGKSLLSQGNTPLASQTSSSIQNRNFAGNRTNTITTGDITVQTQATDTDGIAGAIGKSLKDEFSGAINQMDDGVYV